MVSERQRLDALARMQILDTEQDERFDRITRLVCNILNVPIAAVTLVDEKRQWFKSVQGMALRETSGDNAFCVHTLGSDEILQVSDASVDPRFIDNTLVTGDPYIRFYAGHPVKSPDGITVGALCAIDRGCRHLNDTQKVMLRDLAALVEQQFALLQLVDRDELTGLINRRHFDEQLETVWAYAARLNEPLTVLFMDIDHFKAVNDVWGHAQGDSYLRRISQALVTHVARAGDMVARYGGEEFVALLIDANRTGGQHVAERLREAVARLNLSNPLAPKENMSVSIGGASVVPAAGSNPKDLLARADSAMYQAKQNGRDQVCWAADY